MANRLFLGQKNKESLWIGKNKEGGKGPLPQFSRWSILFLPVPILEDRERDILNTLLDKLNPSLAKTHLLHHLPKKDPFHPVISLAHVQFEGNYAPTFSARLLFKVKKRIIGY